MIEVQFSSFSDAKTVTAKSLYTSEFETCSRCDHLFEKLVNKTGGVYTIWERNLKTFQWKGQVLDPRSILFCKWLMASCLAYEQKKTQL